MNSQGNNHQKPCTLGQWQRQQLILSTSFWNTQSDRLPYQAITRKQSPKTQHTQTMTDSSSSSVFATETPGLTDLLAWVSQGNTHQRLSILRQWQRQQLILSICNWNTWYDWPPYLGITRKQLPKTQHTQTMAETAIHPQYFTFIWNTWSDRPPHLGITRKTSLRILRQWQRQSFILRTFIWNTRSDWLPHLGNTRKRSFSILRQLSILSTFISNTWSDWPPHLGILCTGVIRSALILRPITSGRDSWVWMNWANSLLFCIHSCWTEEKKRRGRVYNTGLRSLVNFGSFPDKIGIY